MLVSDNFYLSIQGWSSIVIVHEKSVFFFCLFFQNISQTAETILIKKIRRNHGISVYKKSLIGKHRKIYIFRDINYLNKKFKRLGAYWIRLFCQNVS